MKRAYTSTFVLDPTHVIEVTSIPCEMDWRFGIDAGADPSVVEELRRLVSNPTDFKLTAREWLSEKLPSRKRQKLLATPLVTLEDRSGRIVSIKKILNKGSVLAANANDAGELILLLSGAVIIVRINDGIGHSSGDLVRRWLAVLRPSKVKKRAGKNKKEK